MNKENYPDKIYATKKIGTNGIHCLDYRNEEEDVEYAKVGNVPEAGASAERISSVVRSADTVCPFCGESGFDLIGLKSHISNGDCEQYNNTENIQRVF